MNCFTHFVMKKMSPFKNNLFFNAKSILTKLLNAAQFKQLANLILVLPILQQDWLLTQMHKASRKVRSKSNYSKKKMAASKKLNLCYRVFLICINKNSVIMTEKKVWKIFKSYINRKRKQLLTKILRNLILMKKEPIKGLIKNYNLKNFQK